MAGVVACDAIASAFRFQGCAYSVMHLTCEPFALPGSAMMLTEGAWEIRESVEEDMRDVYAEIEGDAARTLEGYAFPTLEEFSQEYDLDHTVCGIERDGFLTSMWWASDSRAAGCDNPEYGGYYNAAIQTVSEDDWGLPMFEEVVLVSVAETQTVRELGERALVRRMYDALKKAYFGIKNS